MPNPYPDAGFESDRERWEEGEATFYEQCIDELVKSLSVHLERAAKAVAGGRPHMDYTHLNTAPAHEIALRINAYATMADAMRGPRITRLEAPSRD